MKILMVTEGIERAGGAEEYLSDVVSGLREEGDEVSVLFGQPPAKESLVIAQLSEGGVLVEGLDRARSIREMKRISPDIINFQGVPDPGLLREAERVAPLTVFLHNHESYCPGNSKYFFVSGKICDLPVSLFCGVNAFSQKCMSRRPIKIASSIRDRWQSLSALRRIKKIMCNSQHVKKSLLLNGLSSEKIIVNHLFTRIYAEEAFVGEEEGTGSPMILFVGRLFKEKGVDHFLRALVDIKLSYQAVIVGEGWEKESLKRLASNLGIGEKVEFKGFVRREEVTRLYRSARLLVMPSLWGEPFGLVGVEALSLGLPVVAYGVGGIPEWLENGKSGFLVEAGRIDLLSENIGRLVRDQILSKQLGQAGKKIVAERFTFRQHLENLRKVYREVIDYG